MLDMHLDSERELLADRKRERALSLRKATLLMIAVAGSLGLSALLGYAVSNIPAMAALDPGVRFCIVFFTPFLAMILILSGAIRLGRARYD